jgi:hypothetical protein
MRIRVTQSGRNMLCARLRHKFYQVDQPNAMPPLAVTELFASERIRLNDEAASGYDSPVLGCDSSPVMSTHKTGNVLSAYPIRLSGI